MILEGLVTTLCDDGRTNIAPMGPIVQPDMTRFLLRPFQTSQTFRNLARRPCGVFHVVDDVELIARAALDGPLDPPETFPAVQIEGNVLASACRWYEFRVRDFNDRQARAEIEVEVVHAGRLRDHFGFNRAMHAVLEGTILATRLSLLPEEMVRNELIRLQSAVDKTAGPREAAAWQFVIRYVDNWYQKAGEQNIMPDRNERSPSV